MQTIHIEIKNQYGRDTIYVTSEPHKAAIEKLTGKKTIDLNDIAALKLLGFNVVEPARMGLLY